MREVRKKKSGKAKLWLLALTLVSLFLAPYNQYKRLLFGIRLRWLLLVFFVVAGGAGFVLYTQLKPSKPARPKITREYIEKAFMEDGKYDKYIHRGTGGMEIEIIQKALGHNPLLPEELRRIDMSRVQGKQCTFKGKKYPLDKCILPFLYGFKTFPTKVALQQIGYCEDRYFRGKPRSCAQFIFHQSLLEHPHLLKEVEYVVSHRCDYLYPFDGEVPTSIAQVNTKWLKPFQNAMEQLEDWQKAQSPYSYALSKLGGGLYSIMCKDGQDSWPVEMNFVDDNYRLVKNYLLKQ